MKEQEINKLKKVLKPLVMECIREAIFQEGVLSTLVAEIASGMGTQPIVEKQQPSPTSTANTERVSRRLKESKDKMLEAIGKDAYGGVNVFEGTDPLPNSNTPAHSPMSGRDPGDKGVDIGGLLGAFGKKWDALK